MNKYRVLLVEDNAVDRKIFMRYMQKNFKDHEFVPADCVADAVKIISHSSFDVILADYYLGDGTAFDLLRFINKTPLIVITGMGNEEIAVEALRKGAADYVIKDDESSYIKILPLVIEKTVRSWRDQQQVLLLSNAVKCVSDSVAIMDMQNRLIFVNDAFCRLYGYNADEILGMSSQMLWFQPSRGVNTFNILNKLIPVEWISEEVHITKSGNTFPVFLSCSIVKNDDSDRIAIVVVARDMSVPKMVENDKIKLLDDLEKSLDRLQQMKIFIPFCRSCRTVQDLIDYFDRFSRLVPQLNSSEELKVEAKEDE